jgi:hypothetical protein
MRMEEPRQWQSSEQEWQKQDTASTGYSGNTERYEPDQQESIDMGAGGNYQAQKISPPEELSTLGKVLGTFAIIFSAMGFVLMVIGIVGAGLALRNAHGLPQAMAGGILGLVSSILGMLIFIAFFVTSIIVLTVGIYRARRWSRPARSRTRYP